MFFGWNITTQGALIWAQVCVGNHAEIVQQESAKQAQSGCQVGASGFELPALL